MKRLDITNIYGVIGKVLWVLSGGIVGFLFGGVPYMLIGGLVGFFLAYLLDKQVVKQSVVNR